MLFYANKSFEVYLGCVKTVFVRSMPTKMLVISSYMNLFPKMHISATTQNCHVIRLQVNISLYILRTFLFTFLLELTGRICPTIRSILNW